MSFIEVVIEQKYAASVHSTTSGEERALGQNLM